MAKYLIEDTTLTAIGDSIRRKTGGTETLDPLNMPTVIDEIQTGGGAKPEQEKTVNITENGTTEVLPDEGNVLSKVTVNVEVETGGGSLGYPYLDTTLMSSVESLCSSNANKAIIPFLNTENVVNFESVLSGSTTVTEQPPNWTYLKGERFVSAFDGSGITSLNLNAPKGVYFNYMCRSCTSLTSATLTTSAKATTFAAIFSGCSNLTTVSLNGPSKVGNFNQAFMNCTSLKTINGLDMSSATSVTSTFQKCTALESVTTSGTIQVRNNNLNFAECPLLHDSIINILNALSDNTGLTTYTVTLGTANLEKLSAEEKLIATNKNINLI